MHVGRIAHAANRILTDPPVAPSAVRAAGQMWTDTQGLQPFDVPRALELSVIPAVVEEFAKATRHAIGAGFDGVELHAASGYLPNQFLSPGANQRTDAYGGSVDRRIRFVVETLTAMVAAASAGRVGIKVIPGITFNDIQHDDPMPTYVALVKAIASLGLAYLHVGRAGIDAETTLRKVFPGPLLVGGGFQKDDATRTIADGRAEAISFGTPYIANPDLVTRLERDLPLAMPDRATFYTAGAKGYTDYPVLT